MLSTSSPSSSVYLFSIWKPGSRLGDPLGPCSDTTLLMNSRLPVVEEHAGLPESDQEPCDRAPTARMIKTTRTICRSTSFMDVLPAARPPRLNSRGAETAMIFSPVSGSLPWKGVISLIGDGSGNIAGPRRAAAVRPEVDIWIRPVLPMNCSSIRTCPHRCPLPGSPSGCTPE